MLRVFYFSGTGNARNVAHWMAAAWQARSIGADVANLAEVNVHDVVIGPDDEVALVSPTHGFNFPPITLSFLFAFPRTQHRNRVSILNTRAGLRLGPTYLPGLSGVAQLLAALVLLLKGYRVVGMRPIDLPSNWISIHPAQGPQAILALYQRCEIATKLHAERLLARERDLRALWDLPQDLLLTPVSVLYYLFGRFLFAKSFIASAACDGCGACAKECPAAAIRMVGERPFWSYRCESCMKCMNQCPRRAIETAHGFIAAAALSFSLVTGGLLYPLLRPLVPAWSGEGIAFSATSFILESVLFLAWLILTYRLLHRLLRVRPIERLAVLTSLTHFDGWRRYRAPKRKAPR